MFASLVAVLALTSAVFADPNPTLPGPTDVFKVGGQCNIAWTADPTGKWKQMNIQLMTGDNNPMTAMRTIATVDATTTTNFTWTCPSVTPTSQIYFYQFSSATNPSDLIWVTRFTIAGADGSTSLPTNKTASGVAFGYGTFTDVSQYNAPPAYLNGNGQIVGGSGGSGSVPTPSLPGSPLSTSSQSSSSSSSAPTSGSSTGSSTSSNTIHTSASKSSSSTSSAPSSTPSNGATALFASSSWVPVIGAIFAGAAVAL